MKPNYFLLLAFCFLGLGQMAIAQTIGPETYYTSTEDDVEKMKFTDIRHELTFEAKEKPSDEVLTAGWGRLASRLVPLLVDGASRLFYNPDNFNKEYFANYSFYDPAGRFNSLDINKTLVFEHTGTNEAGKRERMGRFEFELGAVENVEGYHYIGLKSYNMAYSWSKLSSETDRMNYVFDISFYYFDDDDLPQEFHLNPLLLDAMTINNTTAEIENVNYQVIPKMKILEVIQIRVREVNAKVQNWNRFLDLYQSNQNNLSHFLIMALNE